MILLHSRLRSVLRLLTKRAEVMPKDDGTRASRRALAFIRYLRSLSLPQYLIYQFSMRIRQRVRTRLSYRFLRGIGIEIGAQSNPLPLNANRAKAWYVDRIGPKSNAALHNMDSTEFVPVNLYADAESLAMIRSRSLDFVVASHLLEHIPDPIAAVNEWLRILKDDGILFLAVPNRRCNEYDFQRMPVSLDHVVRDFEEKREKKEEHWHEFVRVVEGIAADDPRFGPFLDEHYRRKDFRIHMHVFDEVLLRGILTYVKDRLSPELSVVRLLHFRHGFEIIAIVRKGVPGAAHDRANRPIERR